MDNERNNILIFLGRHGHLPKQGTCGAAGYDILASEEKVLPAQSQIVINTAMSLDIPDNMYGQVMTRSSYAIKGITITGGVIDSDYRGEIKVVLNNSSENEYIIKENDCIAQIIFLHLPNISFVNVDRKEGLPQLHVKIMVLEQQP